ncbi:MAG: hypothetical protein JWN00_228 [Actinomycetia bacterium]|nr:hypothetical protein [Actinomycetes bacterium]
MTTPSATPSAIHDIGYRHYDGPRLGRAYILRSLFVQNLRAAYGLGRPAKAKALPFILFAFMLVPALGSIALVALSKEPRLLIRYSAYTIDLQILVAIFLATQSPVLASRELRSHVIPLYFSRPVGALDFVLAKFGAFTTALFVLLATPVTLLYAGALATRDPKAKSLLNARPGDTPSHVDSVGTHTLHYLGALTGCLLFALVLAALGLVIAAWTPRRGFGVAAVMAVYMLSSTIVLIVQGIATTQGHYEVAGWAGLFSVFNLIDIVQAKLLGATSTMDVPTSALAGPAAALLCAAIVAGALAILYTRFRKAGTS